MTDAPPFAHPAATLVLLRDGPDGLETLLLERHADSFFAGALVFPGGRVDRADGEAAASFRVAAIRECWEEAHILLARPAGASALIDGDGLAALEAGLAARLGREPDFADLVASGVVDLATDALVPFGQWVTPPQSAKRWDTWFFLAPAPPGQVARPDGRETVAARWLTPAVALAEADARRARLVFATRMNVRRLAKSRDAASAFAAAAALADRIVPLCPEVYDTPAGQRVRLPTGLGLAMGYDDGDLPRT
jgi:8-oxo-dGTP pyrophosphatase MutT (NUDIX family)